MIDQVLVQGLMHAGRILVLLTMFALLLFSVYSLSVIGERWWTFRLARRGSRGLLRSILRAVEEDKLSDALALCERGAHSYLAPVLDAGLRELMPASPGREVRPEPAAVLAHDAMARATTAEIERLERGLTGLATLGNISPFVGLFGTVIGVMRAFESISRTGTGGLATVSAGIAEALVATAAGLFVAIPAVCGYNHFVSRVKSYAADMDRAASELLSRVRRRAQGD